MQFLTNLFFSEDLKYSENSRLFRHLNFRLSRRASHLGEVNCSSPTLSKLQIRAIVGRHITRLPREESARNIADELERMSSSGNHYGHRASKRR